MKIEEDDTSSKYRTAQRHAAERQIWRAYTIFGIPLSLAASFFAHNIDPENVRLTIGAITAPLVIIVSLIYVPRAFGSDRHLWEVTDDVVYFRSPKSGSTRISRILRVHAAPLKDLTGYYILTLFSRSGHRESIILEEANYASAELTELLRK